MEVKLLFQQTNVQPNVYTETGHYMIPANIKLNTPAKNRILPPVYFGLVYLLIDEQQGKNKKMFFREMR